MGRGGTISRREEVSRMKYGTILRQERGVHRTLFILARCLLIYIDFEEQPGKNSHPIGDDVEFNMKMSSW